MGKSPNNRASDISMDDEDSLCAHFPYESDEQAVQEFKQWLLCAKEEYGNDLYLDLGIYSRKAWDSLHPV